MADRGEGAGRVDGEQAKTTDALISYSHCDRDHALRIKKALEGHSLTVWMDEDIAPGSEWVEEIDKAIASRERLRTRP